MDCKILCGLLGYVELMCEAHDDAVVSWFVEGAHDLPAELLGRGFLAGVEAGSTRYFNSPRSMVSLLVDSKLSRTPREREPRGHLNLWGAGGRGRPPDVVLALMRG